MTLWHLFIGLALSIMLAGEATWRHRRSQSPRDGRTAVTTKRGRRLEYTLWPPEAATSLGERTVVVHLHGMVASGDDVQLMLGASTDQAAVEALRPRVALIGLDRPGFGASDPSGGGRPKLSDLAMDVVEFVQALGVERWRVVGFSAGGPVALALGARAPAGLERVVTVASPWWWEGAPPSETPTQPRADLAAWAAWPMHKALSYAVGPKLLSLFVSTPSLADRLGTSMARYYEGGAWAAAWESQQIRRGAAFTLDEVQLPVDVFQGTADQTVPPAHAQRLAQQLPRAMLHMVDDADHFSIARTSHDIFAAAAAGVAS